MIDRTKVRIDRDDNQDSGSDGTQDVEPLNDRQLKAVAALLDGCTHADAARAAGAHRVTVTNWTRSDPEFMAELARRRRELLDASVARVSDLAGLALRIVEESLDTDGDPRLAMEVLKLVLPRDDLDARRRQLDARPEDVRDVRDGLEGSESNREMNRLLMF